MSEVLLLARAYLSTAVRERVTLFWSLIFPVFILVVLSLVFGQLGQKGQITFSIGLVSFDRQSPSPFAGVTEAVFEELALPAEPGSDPLFDLALPGPEDEPEIFLAEELLALRRGRRAAVVEVPAGYGREIDRRLLGRPDDPPSDKIQLTIYTSEGNSSSDMATEIIGQVLAGVDRQLLTRAGRFDPTASLPRKTTWVDSPAGETRYIDFLLPGIILMAFFINGLFGIPGTILFSREQRVLRRYWVTPLSVPRYLAGLSIGYLTLCAVQFAILLMIGRFALGSSVSFAAPRSVLFLVLAASTFMAFGFFVASLSKTANAGMAISNILNMPMMFLSGLFFPVTGLPAVLRALFYINPLSYVADGLRASTGVDSGVLPLGLAIGIPVAWIALSSAVSARRFRWDVGQ